ncbi:hypothetical protein GCM10025795_08880 [Verticiella sediminum]
MILDDDIGNGLRRTYLTAGQAEMIDDRLIMQQTVEMASIAVGPRSRAERRLCHQHRAHGKDSDANPAAESAQTLRCHVRSGPVG